MKKLHYALLLFSIGLIACNRSKIDYKQPDLYYGAFRTVEDFNLKGLVKRVQEIEIDSRENLPNLATFDWDIRLENSNIYTFDMEGRLRTQNDTDRGKEAYYFDRKGTLYQSKDEDTDIYYSYNVDGKLKEIKYDDKRENGERRKFIYGESPDEDGSGKMRDYVTMEYYYPNSRYTADVRKVYEFDKQGRVITFKEENDRNLISYNGNVVIDSFKVYGGQVTSFDKITYKNGHLIHTEEFKLVERKIGDVKDVVLIGEHKYKYNHKGELVAEEHISTENIQNNRKYTYSYQYDGEGNWIVKNTYIGNTPITTVIRKINYYKKRYFGILK